MVVTFTTDSYPYDTVSTYISMHICTSKYTYNTESTIATYNTVFTHIVCTTIAIVVLLVLSNCAPLPHRRALLQVPKKLQAVFGFLEIV